MIVIGEVMINRLRCIIEIITTISVDYSMVYWDGSYIVVGEDRDNWNTFSLVILCLYVGLPIM